MKHSQEKYQIGEDPSQVDGFQQKFQKQIQIRIKNTDADKKGRQFEDWVMFRLFTNKNQQVKIQLTSQLDILFYYLIDAEWDMLQLQFKQKDVNIKFDDLHHWWRQILENQKQNYSFLFNIISQNQGILQISQRLNYKTIRILDLSFLRAEQEELKLNLMYRYQRMLNKKKILNNALFEANTQIKKKNPSLLFNFQKNKKQNIFK